MDKKEREVDRLQEEAGSSLSGSDLRSWWERDRNFMVKNLEDSNISERQAILALANHIQKLKELEEKEQDLYNNE
jgi:hypothetical protein